MDARSVVVATGQYLRRVMHLSSKLEQFFQKKKTYKKLLVLQPQQLVSCLVATVSGIILLFFEDMYIFKRMDFDFRVMIYGLQYSYSSWFGLNKAIFLLITLVQILCAIPVLMFHYQNKRSKQSKSRIDMFMQLDRLVQMLLFATLIIYYVMSSLQRFAIL